MRGNLIRTVYRNNNTFIKTPQMVYAPTNLVVAPIFVIIYLVGLQFAAGVYICVKSVHYRKGDI